MLILKVSVFSRFLLQQGASLCSVNCDGDVPLDIVKDEATETLLREYTLTQGMDVEAAKRAEEEWIMRDARHWLTDGLPSSLCQPRTGATPLHVAAAKGYLEAIKLLCQCGVDVSSKDCDGWTPLHAAAHWGQSEACRLLAEQLCDMDAHSNGGQTPFDVADESVVSLLEELSQRQANWRTKQALFEQQNSQISNANTSKKRRSSVCRMSSKDKISVQDQSKERGVSGELTLTDQRETGSEIIALSSPERSRPSPASAEEVQIMTNDHERACPTAVVLPTPQKRESPAESPVITSGDGRKYQAPVRDEESEFQRKAHSRLMRKSRRSTQVSCLSLLQASCLSNRSSNGLASILFHPSNESSFFPSVHPSNGLASILFHPSNESNRTGSPCILRNRFTLCTSTNSVGVTLTDLKEAEKSIVKSSEPQELSVYRVNPNITITPAERDTEPVRESGETQSKLGVRDRRKGRKERRSTGIVQQDGEMDDMDENEDAKLDNSSSDDSRHSSLDFRKLYLQVLQENRGLTEKLQETQMQLNEIKVELEKLRQNQENGSDRPALLELERFEKKLLQRRASELEDELKVLVDLRADNQRLKDENAALIRVISKLSK
ncbi:hypothetical protein DNTS_013292 [Danionella cerebrum]|uniref:cGMP-dependent protein kinase interacting domain-containing protein n=1 Tax=Danionella cerebrum TaxID=2873325 RepID=A0A553PWM9_9TELE|nr:hypothetical protein DNTS_013292 [Danionella translucida]